MEGDITLEGDNDANKQNKNLAFKNNAPFIIFISKILGVKIDNAEDLDVVRSMYNLLKYSKNYRKSDPLSTNYESLKYNTSNCMFLSCHVSVAEWTHTL